MRVVSYINTRLVQSPAVLSDLNNVLQNFIDTHRLDEVRRLTGPSLSRNTDMHPLVLKAFAMLRDWRWNALLVPNPDHLAEDVVNREFWIRDLRRRKLGLFYADHGISDQTQFQPASEDAQFIRSVLIRLEDHVRYSTKLKFDVSREDANPQLIRTRGRKPVQTPEFKALITMLFKLRDEGFSLKEISAELNARNIKTPTGRPWSPVVVRYYLVRRHVLQERLKLNTQVKMDDLLGILNPWRIQSLDLPGASLTSPPPVSPLQALSWAVEGVPQPGSVSVAFSNIDSFLPGGAASVADSKNASV